LSSIQAAQDNGYSPKYANPDVMSHHHEIQFHSKRRNQQLKREERLRGRRQEDPKGEAMKQSG
jgi:hypothetical protein